MLSKAIFVFTICAVFFDGISCAGECASCSSDTDANCAQNPGLLRPVGCNGSNSTCYTRVVNGVTYRGCYSDLDQDIQNKCMKDFNGDSCLVCENVSMSGQGCNKLIFPFNRLKCHTCMENDLNGNCFTGMGSTLPCRTYSNEDQCYIRKTAKSIERGCLSETTKCTNRGHCLICPGEGCNNLMANSTTIPTAPNSATKWTTAMALVLAPVLISLQLTL